MSVDPCEGRKIPRPSLPGPEDPIVLSPDPPHLLRGGPLPTILLGRDLQGCVDDGVNVLRVARARVGPLLNGQELFRRQAEELARVLRDLAMGMLLPHPPKPEFALVPLDSPRG